MTMLWPSFLLGTILSVALLGMTRELIPRTNHEARNALMRNLEDMLYRVLKRQREFDNKSWPFRIKVGDVQDRVLIDAYFIHRKKDEAGGTRSSMQVFAEEATIHFNEKLESVEIRLSDAVVQGNADQPDFVLMNNERIEIPLAREGGLGMDPPVQELTSSQLVRNSASRRWRPR
jgi:lipopolysaccharide export system permease protein